MVDMTLTYCNDDVGVSAASRESDEYDARGNQQQCASEADDLAILSSDLELSSLP